MAIPQGQPQFHAQPAGQGQFQPQLQQPGVSSRRATRAPRQQNLLGDAFVGAPATVGSRILAVAVDLAAIALAAVATWFISTSLALTVVVGVEIAVVLMVAQAITGASLGKLVTKTRVSREEKPVTPGLGRAAVRSAIVGVGAAVAVVGAFVVEMTAGRDSAGKQRTIADRAAGTVVVAVPSASARAAEIYQRENANSAYTAQLGPGSGRGELKAAITSPPHTTASPHTTSPAASHTSPPANAPAGNGAPAAEAQSAPAGPAAAGAGAVPFGLTERARSPLSSDARDGGTLLVFDTGQREQLPATAAVNLGRAPTPLAEGDRIIIVADSSRTISKNHVRLEQSRGAAWVTDLGSTNGTDLIYEDGRVLPLASGERTSATGIARVRMGDRSFTIHQLVGGAE